MQRGEGCRRLAATTAVGPDLVVVVSPSRNDLAGLLQGFKTVLIQALVPEGTVEAFDVGLLGRTARLDQDVFDDVLLRRCHKCCAREFRPVIGSDFL